MRNKVIVNGAKGKMGSLACTTIDGHDDFELVATLTINDDLTRAINETKAQIVVDLTTADSVYKNSLAIIKARAHPVIGTSGLLGEQIEELGKLCQAENLGGIIVPNFSLSAVLMMKFAAMAARFLPEVEIIEAHHQQKLDSPSGTAIKTAEIIALNQKKSTNINKLEQKELLQGARGGVYQGINIHSIRLPGVLANQEVIFGNHGETLKITHNSIDRASFMPGVILACQKVTTLNMLHYGLENVIDCS